MPNKFKVTYTVTTKDPNREPKVTVGATVEFEKESREHYGNGYHMGIRGVDEAFGFQAYDIRYDREFDPKNPMAYILRFYQNRYTGKPNEYNKYTYKLVGISIEEAE